MIINGIDGMRKLTLCVLLFIVTLASGCAMPAAEDGGQEWVPVNKDMEAAIARLPDQTGPGAPTGDVHAGDGSAQDTGTGGAAAADTGAAAKDSAGTAAAADASANPGAVSASDGKETAEMIGTAPKIDINAATAEQLQQLPGIGETKAGAIVEHRRSAGPFRSIKEVMEVKGIGPKLFEKLKDKITVSP